MSEPITAPMIEPITESNSKRAPRLEGVAHEQLQGAVRAVLSAVGEDPSREGLIDTPARVARMYEELLEGYRHTPTDVVGEALFESPERDLVAVCSIPYASFCEHHMLPFTGLAHVAYLPNRKIVGLSKIPRLVDLFSKRLQVQERLTRQIADALDELLTPLGVMVMVEGEHSCARLRGVKKEGVNMVTRATRGVFVEDYERQRAFMEMVQLSR